MASLSEKGHTAKRRASDAKQGSNGTNANSTGQWKEDGKKRRKS
jgi:hypothetical protein